MIHNRQVQGVQIRHIARQIERRDLVSIGDHLLATQKPRHYVGRTRGAFALTRHKSTVVQVLELVWHACELNLVLLRQTNHRLQTRDQLAMWHDTLLSMRRERIKRSLSHRRPRTSAGDAILTHEDRQNSTADLLVRVKCSQVTVSRAIPSWPYFRPVRCLLAKTASVAHSGNGAAPGSGPLSEP